MDANENKTADPTPDQLLKMLDVQIAMQRDKRKQGGRHRTAIIVGGVFLIIAGTLIALLTLQQRYLDYLGSGVRPGPAAQIENPTSAP